MPDDPTNTGKQDDSRVNIEQDYEVAYWSDKFGVTAEQLRSAVAAVGPMVDDVRAKLNR